MFSGGIQDSDKNLINAISSKDSQLNNITDESVSNKENKNLKENNNI
jgi:hypothetical protein